MIEFRTGNMFDEDTEVFVNPVNCVGVMGKGLALEFKRRYPQNFLVYAEACKKGISPGEIVVCEVGKSPKYIVNFPTKKHWREPSKIEYIDAGLDALASFIQETGVSSVVIPALGCGLGGLSWNEVKPLIERKLDGLSENRRIVVFEPN